MKKSAYFILIFLISTVYKIYAQDYLITNKDEFYKVKVIEINNTEIKFKSFNNLNGPIKVLPIELIKSIKYENGEVEKFVSHLKPIPTIESKSDLKDENYFSLGSQDAYKNYRGYSGAGTGTLLTGLIVSPLIALVPALATAGTPPAEHSLNYPSSTLMRNPEYARGYSQAAFSIKKNKVWSNWFISFGVTVAAYALLYNQVNN